MGESTTTTVDAVEVVNKGTQIILPPEEVMPLERVIVALQREHRSREEDVAVSASIEGFLPDAAHAFSLALKDVFGFVASKRSAFGPSVATISVAIGVNDVIEVPWGTFEMPGITGYLSTDASRNEKGQLTLNITGQVKRKQEALVKRAIELTKEYVRSKSIYKGKAFRLRLKNDRGDWLPMPEPKFFALSPELRDELTFAQDVTDSIETNIFTPIEHREQVRAAGVPLKRGILLHGPYGTGKSMTSAVAASLAVKHGWTFIIAERADELADILRLAADYGPAVVFCEDIDQVVSGDRSIDMNDVLNVIDGIESKGVELMVVLTTNHAERINKAMLRAGRLDAVIHVRPPDAAAAAKLMKLYGRGMVAADEDVSEAAELMAGGNAADIREVVERSKLASVRRDPDAKTRIITGNDLLVVARAMHSGEMELRREVEEDTRSEQVKAAQIVANAFTATAPAAGSTPAPRANARRKALLATQG